MSNETTKSCFTEQMGGKPIAGTPAPLPCPFCGDPSMMSVSDEQPGDTFQVICEKCGAWGPPGHAQAGAALAWNRRPATTKEAIERQRSHLFRVMALVDTTEMSLEEEEISQRDTLRIAYEMLDLIATKMELIAKDGTDQEEDEQKSGQD